MTDRHWISRALGAIGLIVTLGFSVNAQAGWFGFGGTSWKEEVQLHDGRTIIVKRTKNAGGRHEIGHSGSLRDQEISFSLPNSFKPISFKSEYSDDIGGINFYLLALHVLDKTPYIIAEPWLCLSYNKWGRPNPPYVIFKFNGQEWQRVPINELPMEFKEMNLLIETGNPDAEKFISSQPMVTAAFVKKMNGELTQYPQYKTILREPYSGAGGNCGVMIYGGRDGGGSGGWHGVGLFGDTPEACLKYCIRQKIGKRYCPCDSLFEGVK